MPTTATACITPNMTLKATAPAAANSAKWVSEIGGLCATARKAVCAASASSSPRLNLSIVSNVAATFPMSTPTRAPLEADEPFAPAKKHIRLETQRRRHPACAFNGPLGSLAVLEQQDSRVGGQLKGRRLGRTPCTHVG